jgi:opacity protein-like surface antigen
LRRSIIALAGLSLASPAFAASYPYLAVQGGIARAKDNDIDVTIQYATTPDGVSQPTLQDDTFAAVYKHGVDLGAAAGYDFGWFRLEGELAHKRVGIDHNVDDDITDQFLGEFNSALNRPSAAPDPGAPGQPPLTLADFQQGGTLNVSSVMVNGMLDLGVIKGLNVYAGVGFGRSFVRGYGDRDGATASQRFAGARYALSKRVEVGLKWHRFSSGIIKLNHDPIAFAGNPDQVGSVVQTTNAALTPDIEGEFRTRGILLSLVYNLR